MLERWSKETKILADFSKEMLPAAIESNLLEMMPGFFASFPQAVYHDEPGLAWLDTGIPHPLFNGVVRVQLSPDEADGEIERIQAYFEERHLPMLWWVWPSAQPGDLGRRLRAHGLIQLENNPGMAIDLHKLKDLPPQPGVQVESVRVVGDLADWIRPVVAGFELPKVAAESFIEIFRRLGLDEGGVWRHYIGRRAGVVVGAASLFLGAGVAGVYNVAVLPKARRCGVGTAVTLAALRDARSMGYRVGILQSSPMGVGVYRRLGFEEYCQLTHYVYLPGRAQRAMLRAYRWLQTAARR